MKGYIYKIVNDINDKWYVGSTSLPLSIRWSCHKSHPNHTSNFYRDLKKYGSEHFSMILVKEIKRGDIKEKENKILQQLKASHQVYNQRSPKYTGKPLVEDYHHCSFCNYKTSINCRWKSHLNSHRHLTNETEAILEALPFKPYRKI
jgi:group I intron endonuclease